MKKEIYHYPTIYLFSLVGISILGIILGSFFDLNISKSIVNTSSNFGKFIESFGLSLSFIPVSLAGVLFLKGLFHLKKIGFKILGVFLFLLCIGLGIYFAGDYLTTNYDYGISFNTGISYLIGTCIILAFTALFYFLIKSDNYKGLIISGCIIVFVMLVQFGLIEFLKNLNSRPRYRYLIDSSLNTTNESFLPWWNFTPFTAKNDYHKSWPSGHTATAGVMLTLPLMTPFLRKQNRFNKVILTSIGTIFALIVAFARIYCGAHFLSDVSFGFLFISLILTLALFIASKVDKRIESKQTSTNI